MTFLTTEEAETEPLEGRRWPPGSWSNWAVGRAYSRLDENSSHLKPTRSEVGCYLEPLAEEQGHTGSKLVEGDHSKLTQSSERVYLRSKVHFKEDFGYSKPKGAQLDEGYCPKSARSSERVYLRSKHIPGVTNDIDEVPGEVWGMLGESAKEAGHYLLCTSLPEKGKELVKGVEIISWLLELRVLLDDQAYESIPFTITRLNEVRPKLRRAWRSPENSGLATEGKTQLHISTEDLKGNLWSKDTTPKDQGVLEASLTGTRAVQNSAKGENTRTGDWGWWTAALRHQKRAKNTAKSKTLAARGGGRVILGTMHQKVTSCDLEQNNSGKRPRAAAGMIQVAQRGLKCEKMQFNGNQNEGQKCEVKPAKKRKSRQEEEEEGIQAKQSPSQWAPVKGSSSTQRSSELGLRKEVKERIWVGQNE
ncbi:hypothetical protein BKA82DRAFT_4017252 [Pisolithus tinctorius]|nr:hypothetical protein BKA82DRAFT_4017252 [Pisolithus tinctorius]